MALIGPSWKTEVQCSIYSYPVWEYRNESVVQHVTPHPTNTPTPSFCNVPSLDWPQDLGLPVTEFKTQMNTRNITKNGHRAGSDVVVLVFPTPPMGHIIICSMSIDSSHYQKKNRSLNYILTIDIANWNVPPRSTDSLLPKSHSPRPPPCSSRLWDTSMCGEASAHDQLYHPVLQPG